MNPDIGSQLGNYRLLRLLGEGGFARVYLSEHIYLQRLAAIKILHLASSLSSEQSLAFLTEARTIARLDHPHIVRILEFGVEHDWPYLIMDYAPNTLRSIHPLNTQVPLALVVSYVSQVASALQYAHEHQVIHRDVKPENMLLGQNNEVLLSDFGIAKVVQNTMELHGSQDIAGTAYYMAPEQFMGQPGPASDQYALAIVVYQWLSGKLPFTGSNMIEICYMHLSVTPPSLSAQLPELPLPIEQVVMKALAKQAAQRFTSIEEFATALENAATTTDAGLLSLPVPAHSSSGSLPSHYPSAWSTSFSIDDEETDQRDSFQAHQSQATITSTQQLPSREEVEAAQEASSPVPLLPSFTVYKKADVDNNVDENLAILLPPSFAQHTSSSLNTMEISEELSREQLQPSFVQQLSSTVILPEAESIPSVHSPTSASPAQAGNALQCGPIPLLPTSSTFLSLYQAQNLSPTPVQPEHYNFFISYEYPDYTWADWIRWHLRGAGYTVLLTERKALASSKLMLEIQEALTKVDHIVAVLSSHYIAAYSSQCYGFSIQKSQGQILPVRIGDCDHSALVKFFDATESIDLVGLDEQIASKRLLESVHILLKPVFPRSTSIIKDGSPVPVLKVFLSYSREDEQHRKQLEKYLHALGKSYPTTSWYDRKIVPGEDFAQQIEKNLSTAHIILLLLSQDFIASNYCYDEEMMKAMKRHEANEARVIPIILRSCTWKDTPLKKLQALPTDGRPINSWEDKDDAFLNVSEGIKKAILEMLSNSQMLDSNSTI